MSIYTYGHRPYGGRDGAMGNVKCKKVAAESGNVHVKSSVPLAPPPVMTLWCACTSYYHVLAFVM